ncbi:MAG TPA: acyl-[acyl-carrier-protein] thioesterase [Candidatus Merdenecus merdavium]|nr:acyl-[acyl-carrier-protein] thioesterase [Candidatus Merdenecus merdavium]
MVYELNSRVRYSEIGVDKKLTLNSIVNYFQDCSTFHSEAVGLGIDQLAKQKHVWMLSSWQIVLDRRPELGEEIVVKTWPYEFKGFYGCRNFVIEDQGGKYAAYANSVWIFVDLETGRPSKVPEDEVTGYQIEEPLDMEYESRKVPAPKGGIQRESFPVRKYHIDTNHHVNNGQYIQMAGEFLPDDFEIVQMRAEYKKAAVYGDRIYPVVETVDNRTTVALCDETLKPYAVIEFKKNI